MTYSHRNIAETVEPRYRYETQRCTVGYAIDPWANGGRTWTMSHQWTDHVGGYGGGTCVHCGKALSEVRVRIDLKPKRRNALAREIALTPADVPPVYFFQGATP